MAEMLSITTERKRRKIKIDDLEFEMLDRDELDLAAGVRLRVLIELGKKKDLTETEARQVSGGLREFVRLLFGPTPAKDGAHHLRSQEILERLSDDQRLTILINFLKGSGKAIPSPASEPLPA